jgi:hypothetical protein
MKAIVWTCVAGFVFWWFAISRASREAVVHGSYYVVARLASAMGLPPPRRTTPAARPEDTQSKRASDREREEKPATEHHKRGVEPKRKR